MAKPNLKTDNKSIITLDVGDKRIGVAHADTSVKLAVAYATIEVDGLEIDRLRGIIAELKPSIIVVGLPRNQSGETTKQTEKVRDFTRRLDEFDTEVVFQDESLTSVLAEEQLISTGKPYTKADIDANAAAIILNDYLEANFD